MKSFERRIKHVLLLNLLQPDSKNILRAKKLGFCGLTLNNELVEFILPLIQNIKKLHIDSNAKYETGVIENLINYSNLTRISIRFQRFAEFRGVLNCVSLTKLSVIYCKIDGSSLVTLLSTTSLCLEKLNIHDDFIPHNLFEAIGKYAKRTPSLHKLSLGCSDDENNSDFGSLFADLSESNLTALYLQEFNFDSRYTREFYEFLQRSNLETLFLNMIGFCQSSLELLCTMFKDVKLKKLNIFGGYLIDEVILSINNIPKLRLSPSLHLLNNILQTNQLLTLDVDNYATPDFLNSLLSCKTLKKCSFNIDSTFKKELKNFIEKCQIESLFIRSNDSLSVDFTNELSANNSIKYLKLSRFDTIGDLVAILQNNNTLISLNTGYTLITDTSSLLTPLQSNYTICYLDCANVLTECETFLQRNRKIRTFRDEKLWKLCYPLITNEEIIPETIRYQWNKNHPDTVHTIIINNKEEFEFICPEK